MLQLIAGLTLLLTIPIWGLMILLPQHDLTKQIVKNDWAFVPMGLLFIFLAVGLVALGADLTGTLSSALNGVPTDPAAINAGALSPLVSALKSMQSGLSALTWGVLAVSSIGDLALGHLIYNETQRLDTPIRTAGILLLLTYLTGPLGMLVFVLWRYLGEFSQAAPVVPAEQTTTPAT